MGEYVESHYNPDNYRFSILQKFISKNENERIKSFFDRTSVIDFSIVSLDPIYPEQAINRDLLASVIVACCDQFLLTTTSIHGLKNDGSCKLPVMALLTKSEKLVNEYSESFNQAFFDDTNLTSIANSGNPRTVKSLLPLINFFGRVSKLNPTTFAQEEFLAKVSFTTHGRCEPFFAPFETSTALKNFPSCIVDLKWCIYGQTTPVWAVYMKIAKALIESILEHVLKKDNTFVHAFLSERRNAVNVAQSIFAIQTKMFDDLFGEISEYTREKAFAKINKNREWALNDFELLQDVDLMPDDDDDEVNELENNAAAINTNFPIQEAMKHLMAEANSAPEASTTSEELKDLFDFAARCKQNPNIITYTILDLLNDESFSAQGVLDDLVKVSLNMTIPVNAKKQRRDFAFLTRDDVSRLTCANVVSSAAQNFGADADSAHDISRNKRAKMN